MKKLFVLFFVTALMGYSAPINAEEFTFPDGKVDLVCPDKWKHEIKETSLTMSSPDEAVSFVFDLCESDDLKKSVEEAEKEIVEALGPVEFKDPVEEKIGEMDALTFEGTSKDGVNVLVSILNTPADKALCVYYFGNKTSEEQYAKEIAEIINGIKPAAAVQVK